MIVRRSIHPSLSLPPTRLSKLAFRPIRASSSTPTLSLGPYVDGYMVGGVDLVLSSGFLAFAKHAGFLKAVEQADLEINGVMGTSAGAYAGSLFCAGYKPDEIAEELCCVPPIYLLRPNFRFWRGFLLLDQVVKRLYDLLPPTFESLNMELAVGVINAKGQHQLIDSGPLPEAVAASGAVPVLFAPVDVPGARYGPFFDGGWKDRIGLQIWRERRRHKNQKHHRKDTDVPDALVHLISRSTRFSGTEDIRATGEKRVSVLRTEKSGRSLFSLGDYTAEMQRAYHELRPSVIDATERIKRKTKVCN